MNPSFQPLTDFRGVARLFPLPNLVLFPHAVTPLHIFEPRYVALVEDALAGDQLIAMALLRPGWESDYEGRPPVAPVVCIGRILTHAQLADGKYNLLLSGVQRGMIRRELPPERPFREAAVELLDDFYAPDHAEARMELREELTAVLSDRLPSSGPVREQLEQMLGRPLPLGSMVDVIAHAVAWPVEIKQQLLEELNVDRRTLLLLDHLRSDQHGTSPPDHSSPWTWPPRFSDN